MPSNPTTSDMGRLHEEHAAEIFGGARSRGSGSTWKDQTDGYNGPDEPFSFRWDCKSTKAASISVGLATIEKVTEQAQGHRWAIPLRIYGNDKLTVVRADLVALKDTDVAELLEAARSWETLTGDLSTYPAFAAASAAAGTSDTATLIKGLVIRAGLVDGLRKSLAEAKEALTAAAEAIAARNLDVRDAEAEVARLRDREAYPKELAQWVPKLPWTVIRIFPEDQRGKSADDPVGTAVHYEPDGPQRLSKVRQVRVQRSAVNRPQVFADNVRIRNADVFGSDGRLLARSCEDDESIEEG